MIKRVTKKVADQHIEAHMRDESYPITVIMAGNGRYYISQDEEKGEMELYLKEWKAAKDGEELPSFPLEEDNATGTNSI